MNLIHSKNQLKKILMRLRMLLTWIHFKRRKNSRLESNSKDSLQIFQLIMKALDCLNCKCKTSTLILNSWWSLSKSRMISQKFYSIFTLSYQLCYAIFASLLLNTGMKVWKILFKIWKNFQTKTALLHNLKRNSKIILAKQKRARNWLVKFPKSIINGSLQRIKYWRKKMLKNWSPFNWKLETCSLKFNISICLCSTLKVRIHQKLSRYLLQEREQEVESVNLIYL